MCLYFDLQGSLSMKKRHINPYVSCTFQFILKENRGLTFSSGNPDTYQIQNVKFFYLRIVNLKAKVLRHELVVLIKWLKATNTTINTAFKCLFLKTKKINKISEIFGYLE